MNQKGPSIGSKVRRLTELLLSLSVGIGLPALAFGQTYHYSGPISGGTSLSVRDAGYSGSIGLTFSNLTLDVVLDPAAVPSAR